MTDDFFDTIVEAEHTSCGEQYPPSQAELIGLFLLATSSFTVVGLLCLAWWWLT